MTLPIGIHVLRGGHAMIPAPAPAPAPPPAVAPPNPGPAPRLELEGVVRSHAGTGYAVVWDIAHRDRYPLPDGSPLRFAASAPDGTAFLLDPNEPTRGNLAWFRLLDDDFTGWISPEDLRVTGS